MRSQAGIYRRRGQRISNTLPLNEASRNETPEPVRFAVQRMIPGAFARSTDPLRTAPQRSLGIAELRLVIR
jgi:hypothetical protein